MGSLNMDDMKIAAEMAAQPDFDDGVITHGGVDYMYDAKGRMIPLSQVKDRDRLQDQTVRKIFGFAADLSAQIARFRQHTFDDVDALAAILREKYGAAPGGQKGNISLTSYDGLMMIKLALADNIVFGPELQAAKALVDECLNDWAHGAHANLRTIVEDAFEVDQEGKINRGKLLGLRRLDFDDERWSRAMEAINDSIRVIGSKRYVRIYRRDRPDAGWVHVSIDAASAGAVS